MIYHESLEQLIERTRRLGDALVPLNWPLNQRGDEQELSVLKGNTTTVDGYEISLHYNKADHGHYYLETLQIYGQHAPFLPFCVVCKVARRFLGSKYLYLVELMQEHKKVYIWTVCVDKNGPAIENPRQQAAEFLEFEGFEYRLMDSKSVQFY